MKRCPICNRTYTDVSLNFCLEDGTPLVSDVARPIDLGATVRDNPPQQTGEPPPTEIYRQEKPMLNQAPEVTRPRQPAPAPQWSPAPQMSPPRKSNAMWWILGGVGVVGIIGIGLIIMILALASISSNDNANNDNANNKVANLNTNTNTKRTANTNASVTPELPASLTDDFSETKWRTGYFEYGVIWYADVEYHMRAKDKSYLVMYAPSGEYNSEGAAVRVTARSVEGIGPTSGYGLIVHGQKSTSNELEDYALLIYTGDEPQYEIVMHKAGTQTTLVPWTKTSALRSGANPNQLEVRSKGDQVSFYINGLYLTRITDKENFKRGVAGLYTREAAQEAFDDLEIER
jgi:hypothetical protein